MRGCGTLLNQKGTPMAWTAQDGSVHEHFDDCLAEPEPKTYTQLIIAGVELALYLDDHECERLFGAMDARSDVLMRLTGYRVETRSARSAPTYDGRCSLLVRPTAISAVLSEQ
jgi:hypothetical protein